MSLFEDETIGASTAIRVAYDALKTRLNKVTAENEYLVQQVKFLTRQNKILSGGLDELRYPSSDADTESSCSPKFDFTMSRSHPASQLSPLVKISCCCVNCCKSNPCTCQKLSLHESQYCKSNSKCDASTETPCVISQEGGCDRSGASENNYVSVIELPSNLMKELGSGDNIRAHPRDQLSRFPVPPENMNHSNTGLCSTHHSVPLDRISIADEPDEYGGEKSSMSLQTYLVNAVSTAEDLHKQISTLRIALQSQSRLLVELFQQQQRGPYPSENNGHGDMETSQELTPQSKGNRWIDSCRHLIGNQSPCDRVTPRGSTSGNQHIITCSTIQNNGAGHSASSHSINQLGSRIEQTSQPMSYSVQEEWNNSDNHNELRICPMCNKAFDSETKQSDFQRHVFGHFSDNEDLDANFEIINH